MFVSLIHTYNLQKVNAYLIFLLALLQKFYKIYQQCFLAQIDKTQSNPAQTLIGDIKTIYR